MVSYELRDSFSYHANYFVEKSEDIHSFGLFDFTFSYVRV